ncbi:CGNR zinc finger domain-containing protein [Ensifer sp. PDNC004]|uniref:CGNR zinc finger domain-containing protein n=1 Tax=Ensifer sp. PDNC004 TaxID=2811423 RepID=UPI001964095F|nr:CGNR zinc finger domain-containing protein [Ensifer sp. PDNC004]QRY69826.1 CGNR zinc finger domain-containing protein [Ensifer sp. PDNC004]
MDLVPFVGEPLALDLVNTRPWSASGRTDLLAADGGLTHWLALERGRLPDLALAGIGATGTDDLAPVLAVRSHVASAIAHVMDGQPVPAADIDGLNAAMRAAPVVRRLDWTDPPRLVSERTAEPMVQLAGFFAEDAAALLAGADARLIRKCEAEDCVMLFVGSNARRRWCSAARCGNRVRVSRYYQRSKTS